MTDFHPTIAIVDDNDSVLKALRRLLTAAGFEACVFHSGREFIESLTEHPFRCVILDVLMPGLDGFTVARLLAERIDRIPVIFMSAHDSGANRRRAKKLKATAFLRKPTSEEEIITAVQQAIDSAESYGDENKDGANLE